MEISPEISTNKIPVKTNSQEYRKALCEEWQSSGILASQFCRRKGLNRSTFHRWCKELGLHSKNKKQDLNKKSNKNWIPLTYNNNPSREVQGLKLVEITVYNQMMMRLSLSMDDIQLLLKGLCNATTVIR